jgi:phosphoglycerol transferase MdoB-like AlkP superfamily enzyme
MNYFRGLRVDWSFIFNRKNKLYFFVILFVTINLFILINIIIFFLKPMGRSIFEEIYFLGQMVFFNLAILYLVNNKIVYFCLGAILNLAYFILAFCSLVTGRRLDFFYLTRNWGHVSYLLGHFSHLLIFSIVFSLLYTLFVSFLKLNFKPKKLFILLIILVGVGIFLQPQKYNNELVYFLKTINNNDKVIGYYESQYEAMVQRAVLNKQSLQPSEINPPDYLKNIFIIHLESLNAFLVNEQNTPNLLKIAKEGIFFDRFYSNSIQTIGAYENILCSLPTSFKNNLVNTGLDKKVACLPNILKAQGYATEAFKGGARINLTKTDVFLKNIGFSEIHNDDIMNKDDIKYMWGYREDVFFPRVFAYLKDHRQTKNFIYIDVGTTNHYPFVTPVEFSREVPYPEPRGAYQSLSNTIFLQDKFLAIAWEELNKLFPQKDFTLIILSDNSWPVGLNDGNTFNEAGSFEENFRIPAVVIMGGQENYKGKIINSSYGQLDIMPSLLDYLGIKMENNQFSTSFKDEVEKGETPKRQILLIQPYADKYINIIEGNLKYQYNSEQRTLFFYDLDKDALEKYPQTIYKRDSKKTIDFLGSFFLN